MEKRAPAMGIYRIQDGLGQILGKACTGTLPFVWKLGVAFEIIALMPARRRSDCYNEIDNRLTLSEVRAKCVARL